MRLNSLLPAKFKPLNLPVLSTVAPTATAVFLTTCCQLVFLSSEWKQKELLELYRYNTWRGIHGGSSMPLNWPIKTK